MKEKILKLLARLENIEADLGNPEVLSDQSRYKALTQEHSHLSELKDKWERYEKVLKVLQENRLHLKAEEDPELVAILNEEIQDFERQEEQIRRQLENLLVPPDPTDSKPIVLELRAGTGGDEAAIFVGDCARMYRLYADKKGWKYELLSCTESTMGGFKEYILAISGANVYRLMKYEAGTHRVQRVPDTETQGRVHTSAITVAVLLEPEEDEEVELDERDLKIDTYRASGAGGQHVNTTDSAVRITHLPTNTVVYCQQERSQHKNKEKAMRLLRAKIASERKRKQQEELSELRASMVGTGDRSERIRTYNFPQNRVTDHRIDLTIYKLDHVINGELDSLTEPLVSYFHHQKLTT